MSAHVLADRRLACRDTQLLQLPVNPRRTPQGIRGGQLADQGANVGRHTWPPVVPSTFPRPEQAKAAPVPCDDGFRLDDVNGRTPATPACESQAHNTRSADVRPRRGRLDRCTTASWCRSAMISKCSEARERTMNWSEWSRERRTDDTTGGYRRMPGTSIDATRTVFSGATGWMIGSRDRSRAAPGFY